MLISDWSSDVCSSDLKLVTDLAGLHGTRIAAWHAHEDGADPTRVDEWDEYETYMRMAEKADSSGRADAERRHREAATGLREAWFADGIAERGQLGSSAVLQAIDRKSTRLNSSH